MLYFDRAEAQGKSMCFEGLREVTARGFRLPLSRRGSGLLLFVERMTIQKASLACEPNT